MAATTEGKPASTLLDRSRGSVFSPYGNPAASSEEGLSFLRSRLLLCWKFGALISGGFAVLYLVGSLLTDRAATVYAPGLANSLASLVGLSCWLLLRRVRSFTAVALVDLIGTFLMLGAWAAGFLLIPAPPEIRHDLVMVQITTMVLTVRAVGVPASVRHTIAVSIAGTLPALAMAGVIHWLHPLPTLNRSFGHTMLIILLLCSTTVALAVFTSWMVYGLRSEVAAARQLGQYILEEKIGQGGLGTVYLARHALLRRPTALKLLSPARVSPDALARFEREVRLTSTLTHPNTVGIFDYGRAADGVFYYAMEYLDGIDLELLVRRFGPQPPSRVIHILQQACGSLIEAHDRGLVHRDVKPSNIILCQRGGMLDMVKVVDFGLVKDISGQADASTLSRADMVVGTPLYMSPEVLRGSPSLDGRVDLYGLGGVGYFLLTGQTVFQDGSVAEVCAHHLHTSPEPPSSRLGIQLPEDLEALVLRCLAKAPEDRPATAAELRRGLLTCAVPPWTEDQARAWWASHGGIGRPSGELDGLLDTERFELGITEPPA